MPRPYDVDESLGRELRDLINRHSVENASDTPDWILAMYLLDCLFAYERAVDARHAWHELGKPS